MVRAENGREVNGLAMYGVSTGGWEARLRYLPSLFPKVRQSQLQVRELLCVSLYRCSCVRDVRRSSGLAS